MFTHRFCVEHYKVMYNGFTDDVSAGSQQEVLHQVNSLDPCHEYNFEIRSVNAMGSSSPVHVQQLTLCDTSHEW